MSSSATVVVVDDQEIVRYGLTRLLRPHGWEVLGYASAEEFLEHGRPAGDACLLLDVQLPGMTGPELQARLAETQDSLPIVFLTGNPEIRDGIRAMKAGALDYLEKPVEREELVAVVRRALAQDRVERARAQRLEELECLAATLTRRERQVFALVTTGLLNKQVARTLGTAEKTIKVHRGNVMRKMRAGSLADLVRMASLLGVDADTAVPQA